MAFFEKYLARMETEGNGPEQLNTLYQEAERSLEDDPPEQALAKTSQMVGALLIVARKQDPLQQELVDAVNALTVMLADYIEHLGFHWWAVKTETGWVYSTSPSGFRRSEAEF